MIAYHTLEVDQYYLIQSTPDDEVILISPIMETKNCLLLCTFEDDAEYTYWVRKSDKFEELVDTLTEEEAVEFENIYLEDDDMDEDWFDMEDLEDDDDDHHQISIN